ncbi:hypothetical protein ACQP2F_14215 [Actinoplanes sp. CA-030573]|uniref:hypothetical protein n=1 Tax=Actinoplanes sp. CA-030573 TaxID=3239898 RepID=UPI003D93804C
MLIAAGATTVPATAAAAAVSVSVTSSGTYSGGTWGGAVCNGTTNDRAKIQSSIDYVAASGGGTVTIPGGTATTPRVCLTGDLTIKSNVTLNIQTNAVLKQSNNSAHYLHAPKTGRFSGVVQYDIAADSNYPLIGSFGTSNVRIVGGGKIQMVYSGNDNTSFILHSIGFNKVTNFEISNIVIDGATAYNIAIRNSDGGLRAGANFGNINNVRVTNPRTQNSDGVSVMNSSNLKIHDNSLTTLDDGIYVWASYRDPRGGTWWDSNTARPVRNIEIYNNDVNNIRNDAGTFGFAIFGWTSTAPDASQTEISNIKVYNNKFRAPDPIGAIPQDIYHKDNLNRTPTRDLTFAGNQLTTVTGTNYLDLGGVPTTNLARDDTGYNFGQQTTLVNRDFDGSGAQNSTQVKTSFWSTEGDSGTSNTSVGQPGGYYGFIRGNASSTSYAGLYQGVYLSPGTYTFSARVQTSGAAVRMFAIRASDTQQVGYKTVTSTAWQTVSVPFSVTTTGVYRLGIDSSALGSSSSNYGRIDSTVLTKNS